MTRQPWWAKFDDVTVSIRRATPSDYDAIDDVVREAFGPDEGPAVATMVRSIRTGEFVSPDHELVAEEDGQVVGQVCLSGTPVRAQDGTVGTITMLSPLAVRPGSQGSGIGSALVRAVLHAATHDGVPFVVLEGSPQYYGRFGFGPAAAYGLHLPIPDWAPPEAAQILVLDSGAPVPAGQVDYPAYVP